jgi:adenine-specific DNA-methyltransferase
VSRSLKLGAGECNPPDPWRWPAHLWPLYCAFAEHALGKFAQHREILLAGLPKPGEGFALPAEDDLSSLYSGLNDPEDVKRFGKFYTPATIASYILNRLDYPGKREGSLLDPACGTGVFLVEAARRFLTARPKAHWEDLVGTIQGIDLDPVAVLIARTRLLEVALEKGLEVGEARLRIECRDALDAEVEGDGTLFEGFAGCPAVEKTEYVVGNPPYGKVHSSDPRIAQYRGTIYGHANLYGIFLALAVDKLREGGRLGFVVPRSFASGLYFQNLRQHLLDTLRFDEIAVFGSRNNVFPGVLQETLLLLATKESGPGATVVWEPQDPSELAEGRRPGRAIVVPEEDLSLGPRYNHVVVMSANPVAHEVLKRIRRHSRPLSEHGLKASTGRLVWNRVKKYLRVNPEPGALRVYWPANVRPYVFDLGLKERSKFNYAVLNDCTRGALSYPEDLVITKRTSAKEQARRIEAGFIRGDHPDIAKGFFLENHLNFVRRVSGQADLRVVSAVLNARITNVVFAMMNGNTQVSATELMHLPLPQDLGGVELVELAGALDAAPLGERSALAYAFERALWRAYGLPDELVELLLAA